VLAITVHVFVFIVYALLDDGRVTGWRPHDIQVQVRIQVNLDGHEEYGLNFSSETVPE
jgi:hypothetical protein